MILGVARTSSQWKFMNPSMNLLQRLIDPLNFEPCTCSLWNILKYYKRTKLGNKIIYSYKFFQSNLNELCKSIKGYTFFTFHPSINIYPPFTQADKKMTNTWKSNPLHWNNSSNYIELLQHLVWFVFTWFGGNNSYCRNILGGLEPVL